jgi:hypothetical protein
VVAVASGLAACTPPVDPPDPPDSPTGCNGVDALCTRSFDQVAYLTTHNAMSSSAYSFLGPNQTYSFTGQLDRGVRALMLDIHRNGESPLPAADLPSDAVLLCHEYCAIGHLSLVTGLAEIKAWLDDHPREVITLILENYVSASDLDTAMTDSGLAPRLFDHAVGTPWPTLGEMIAADRRVVVLTDSQGSQRPWLLPAFAEAWDTNWSAAATGDLTCGVNRGSFSNRLVILNNFLTNPIASTGLADAANSNPFLAQRIESCRADWGGRIPNFVTVDFFERGDAAGEVRALNES